MSDALLRRTIRRCTAFVLIVLGAIAVELASIEYPDGGNVVGGAAMFGSALYLALSALEEIDDRDELPGRTPETGDDGSDDDSAGDGDGSNDDAGGDGPSSASMPPFGD
ncbi:hypothetical protein SAMN05216559_2356 [Halomicrobium zhouii]|uniref:Uncharacterized protein n=1 Tax=Halomicrobium zhouii TaxID=767519 RepID=A0A1I6LAF5_9EURY|nr:hypothetical protein [Halomicrobium zhouii]SFS00409.1 hypothetical protein SAMN05216559_2356 [Halomicrobium zhouii]